MWTKATGEQHAPRKERYPADLTDAEWGLIELMIPEVRCGAQIQLTGD